MANNWVDQALECLEKANAELEPELLVRSDARKLLDAYARAQRLAGFGVAALARKVDDAAEIAKATGVSMGTAKATVATGRALRESDDLSNALQNGAVSLDQAAEIAKAEESSPGAAAGLLTVAENESFHVLKEQASKVKLDAEEHKDLFIRQRAARSARNYSDELGMVHVHLAFEPHVGVPITARAEAEAERIAKAARRERGRDDVEPFERYLADAYARLLSGEGKGRAKRPELVVLVSHEVAKRGWKDVKAGEVCKIPGVGPVSPQVAKEIAQDAFLTGVCYDGKDLREIKRWTRSIPIEVALALELGKPPDFDGVKCSRCGTRFGIQFDHVDPHVRGGPASTDNLDPKCCWTCHPERTDRDRRTGRLAPAET